MKTRKWVHYVLGIVVVLVMVLGGQSRAVAASANLQTGTWLGEYYANTDLIGGPALTRQDPAIDFSWGTGAPAAGIPADGFSVRWTRTVSLEAGLYRFRATVDDGMRVFLDSALIIDSWRDGGQRELTADRQISTGMHTLRVEYYERAGIALARLRWEKVGTPTYPDWRGEYWNNVNLSGNPALVRADKAIDFDWGTGAPAAGISADGFSARWTRTATFTEGLYLFRATVDDGIRVYVDGTLVIDEWRDGGQRELIADRQISAGMHTLRVEYYERAGIALARLRWEKVGTPTYPDWQGAYWNNANLSGNPALVRADKAIDFDWGTGAPATGISADNFAARWTRTATFTEGLYLFRATVDDGIRVYVDGTLVIDEWRDGGRREVRAERRMTAGSHMLRVEYYERGGAAVARFGWEDVTPSTLGWKGEYWANLTLTGNPALVRTDKDVAFDWGQRGPGGTLPSDNFSARWTRRAYFDGSTYRFNVLVDDGMRLWVDNQLILDAWTDHDSARMTANQVLTQGTHTLKVEYYERIGNARVWVWWEKATVSVYSEWKGEYWNNRTLSGDLVLVRNDRDINFDWGKGSPSPSLPVDDFSARWTRVVPLESGLYRFHVLADDGIRLWIDGQLRYDAWRNQEARDMTLDLNVSKGTHDIKVEYYEQGGSARVHVWWERISAPTYPDWKGEYWKNRDLSGSPALVRNDPSVVFDWGTDAPAVGLPSDNFSVRWSRQVTFSSGRYRFYALADDGIRVRLNDAPIINEWHDSSGDKVYTADVSIDGTRNVVIEYYERGGGAQVHFWWSRIGN